LNMVMKLRVPHTTGNVLTRYVTIIVLRRILLLGGVEYDDVIKMDITQIV
jgi:hypothetical protein